jgi:hypothetical protein
MPTWGYSWPTNYCLFLLGRLAHPEPNPHQALLWPQPGSPDSVDWTPNPMPNPWYSLEIPL